MQRPSEKLFRSRTVSLDQLIEKPQDMPEDHSDILEAVLKLPARFRDVVYLHYYEGYSAPEIGRILKKIRIQYIHFWHVPDSS